MKTSNHDANLEISFSSVMFLFTQYNISEFIAAGGRFHVLFYVYRDRSADLIVQYPIHTSKMCFFKLVFTE